jgi:hypothetical protein
MLLTAGRLHDRSRRTVTLKPLLLAAAASLCAFAPASHRLVPYAAGGYAILLDATTGAPFYGRGANYIHLDGGMDLHNLFDVGVYNPAAVDLDLAYMQWSGLNYFRVFITTFSYDAGWNMTQIGIDPAWLNNVVDLLSRARQHGLKVVLTGGGLPANYWRYVPEPPGIGPNNMEILDPNTASMQARFWTDFLTGLKTADPNALTGLLAIDVSNEASVWTNEQPLNLTSGNFGAFGNSYNLALPSDRQRLITDGARQWLKTVSSAIKAVDPQVLVEVSQYTPAAVGRSSFDGAVPSNSKSYDYPAVPPLLSEQISGVDLFDEHIYPPLDPGQAMASAGMVAGAPIYKPLFIGEIGAWKSLYPAPANATPAIVYTMRQTCIWNRATGWALWTWNTTNELQSFWNETESNGAINGAISPLIWPRVC